MAESLGTAVLDLTTDDSRLRSGLARGERDVHSSFGRMSMGVIRAAAGIATAFGAYKLGKALFVDPIKMAGNFQQTLNVLQTQTRSTGAEMKKMSALALKLGADVKLPATSAQDAADAMLQLGKAGFSVGEIMTSTRDILLLSAAAEISNADAADMVTKAMGGFGLSAKDTKLIVDDLAGAANQSQSSIQDVGFAMTMSGAAFKSAKVPIGDAATAIALMAKHGITGSMAGSALNQAFLRLGNPTKAMTAQFKEMGVHMFKSNGDFVGMRSAIEQLSPKLAGMTTEQRLHALAVLGGSRASKAMQFVLGASVKEWDRLKAAVTRHGQAQDLANAKMKGFNGAMLALRSTFENLQITLGTRVLPKMTEFIHFLTRVAGAKSFTIAIKIVWEGVVSVVGDLKAAIADALFGHGAKQEIVGHGFVIGADAVAFDPGLIAKLRATLEKMIASTDWGALGKRIGDGISKSIKISTDAVNQGMNAMLAWVNSHSGQIAAIGLVIGLTMIQKILDPAFWAQHWQLIGGVILAVASTIFTPAKFAVLGVKLTEAAFGLFGATVGKVVLAGLELLPGVVGRFAPRFARAIGGMIEGAVTLAVAASVRLVAAVIERISGGFGKLGGIVKTLMYTGVVGAIGSIIGAAAGKAKDVATAAANGIKTMPGKLAGLAGDLIGRIGGILGQVAGWARTAFRQVGFAIADGIISGIGNLASRAAGVVTGALGGLKDKAMSFLGAKSPSKMFADSVGAAIGEGIIKGFTDSMAAIHPKMTGILQEVASHAIKITKDNASKVGSAFKSWSDDANKKFDEGIATLQTKLKAELEKGQAAIERMKAKLTPAELQIQIAQAQAAAAKVQIDLNAAWVALKALKGQQEADWARLLADQKKNLDTLVSQQAAAMAQLQAAQKPREVDAAISTFEFGKTVAANQGNQPALNLLQAKQNLETWKAYYAEGKVTMDDVLRYQQAFDDASLAVEQSHNAAVLAAGDDTHARELADQQYANGQKLLQDYDTWANLQVQAAQGAANILAQQAIDDAALQAQQATDEATRIALLATFNQQTLDATGAKDAALDALLDFNLQRQADKERGARDRDAIELNSHLVARYQRIEAHLNTIKKRTDDHWDEMIRGAIKSGGNLIESLANAIENSKPTLTAALQSISREIAKYLKVSSPTEKGPMSTLDHWWDKFAPTLIKGLDSKLITDTISGAVSPRLNLGMMTPYATDKTRAMSMLSGGTVNLNQTFHETPANADPVAIGAVTSYALKTLRT